MVIPITNIVDPELGGFRGWDCIEDKQRWFIAPGEQIYAMQCRKARWRWFTSNKVDEMMLVKKAWWERPRDLEGESEDVVGVELEDEIALEGDRDEYVVKSGEVFVSAVVGVGILVNSLLIYRYTRVFDIM
ncbi:hypothetical protein GP486_004758 [Trichoglossum hirsutum]|uniref:Uncharacterized protein n=1 Tax=Trichoglossum hirsutum TaxID=265104 RepID=A0A9P8RNH5_9PEZI|nr:hypothetical protein GP486_004758 [Trichoglossum hirsutum]